MSKSKTKRYLVLLAAVGLVAAALGGTGTFASFSAETSNNGNYFATGTLLLHNNGGTTTCTSETDTTDNSNIAPTNNCDVLFNYPISDQSPHFAQLTLTNAGTLDATDIKWSSPAPGCQTTAANVNATLGTALVSGNTVTTLAITPLLGSAILNAGSFTLTYGTHTQTFTAGAGTSIGGSSIAVSGAPTANFSYPIGSAIHAGPGPTFGAGGNLCPNLQVVVIETDNTFTPGTAGCAYGTVNVLTCSFNNTHTLGTSVTDVPSALTDITLAAGGPNTNALDASKSRYFLIGVQLAPTAGNTFQNRAASFDLRWHIDT